MYLSPYITVQSVETEMKAFIHMSEEYLQRLIVTPAREFDKACANINKRNILLN